jgi:tRNA A-37 threonylcarbamoyl transferase component Bud32
MYVIAASYVAMFALVVYLACCGPVHLTVGSTFANGAMTIRSVTEGSPEWRAGLRVGDRVVSIDGLPVRGVRDWLAATANLEVGRPQLWQVARGDERLRLEIDPLPASLHSRLSRGYAMYFSLLISGMGLGLLIAWKRPGDAVGRLGAWFMATASIAFGFPWGWAVAWRAQPALVQGLLWIPQLSRFVLEGILLSFRLVFPRRLPTRRWPWLLVWLPVLATLPWRAASLYGVIYPGEARAVPAWILQAGFVRTIVYLLAAPVILVVSYRRLLDRDEKRRVRVLMLGTAVSAVSAMSVVWIDSFLGRASPQRGGLTILAPLLFPLTCACPLSLAYAILRHRVLGISLILRQGLQYFLARGAVIALVPAFAVVLVADLALNREQPLAEILGSRGWLYLAAVGLSGLAYSKRREWLDAIDRRFFRERYDAQQLLREVLEKIRAARDFARVAPLVAQRLEAAFHPEFVAVMRRARGDGAYRPLVSLPAGHEAAPPLAADGKLVGLLRVLGGPLEVLHSDAGWLSQRLPSEEATLLRQARVDLLVPIAMTSDKDEALLALGVKRSEEPYTREDRDFLEGIATSLALLIEQPGVPAAAAGSDDASACFQECPECGTCYEGSSTTCAAEGATLARVRAPRTLARRYRLDRRLGHGGMGTVYEAHDAELGRRVAVKLIREDWSDRIDARQRFRREARAGAAFAHPNVVTVHDYGVEGERHAFLVMELLEGVTLAYEVRRNGRLVAARVVEIFRGVCAAVAAAHQHHLIHRDLKPANIFLAQGSDGAEVVKVLDFGVAKLLPVMDDSTPTQTRDETGTGVLVGTPAYMSPEQLRGGEPDPAWDLWALAVVAYEALTGALPFAGDRIGWQAEVLAGAFTPPCVHVAEPPMAWEPFFRHCFSTRRSERPASAAEFLERLQAALAPEGPRPPDRAPRSGS